MPLACLPFAAVAGAIAYGWLRRNRTRAGQPPLPTGPVVALVAALTLGLAWRLSGDLWEQVVFAAAALGLVLVSAYDLATKRLPDNFTLPAIVLSIAAVLAGGHGVGRAVVCGGLAFVLFGVLWLAGRGKGIGLGDVKLAPTIGLLAGWLSVTTAVATLYLSVFGAALYAIGLVLASGRGRPRPRDFAYGPFLSGGLLVAVLIWG